MTENFDLWEDFEFAEANAIFPQVGPEHGVKFVFEMIKNNHKDYEDFIPQSNGFYLCGDFTNLSDLVGSELELCLGSDDCTTSICWLGEPIVRGDKQAERDIEWIGMIHDIDYSEHQDIWAEVFKSELDSQREYIRNSFNWCISEIRIEAEEKMPGIPVGVPSCKVLCDWVGEIAGGSAEFDTWRNIDFDGLAFGVYLECFDELSEKLTS